jgi:hypothetical protein
VATNTYTDPGLRQLRAPVQDAADLAQVLAEHARTVARPATTPSVDDAALVAGLFGDGGRSVLVASNSSTSSSEMTSCVPYPR